MIPVAALSVAGLAYKIEPRWIIFVSTAGAAIGFYFLSYLDPKSTAWDIMIPLGAMAFFMGLVWRSGQILSQRRCRKTRSG